MKSNNKLLAIIFLACLGLFSSCDDFFNLYPKDQLTPSTFWKTSKDVDAAVTAAYNWWCDNHVGSSFIFYQDCMSDIGFNYNGVKTYKQVGNGSLSVFYSPSKWRGWEIVRRANFVILNIDKVPASEMDEETKLNYLAQARAIRAYMHACMVIWYGDAFIMDFIPNGVEESRLERIPAEQVKKFALDELNWCAENLPDEKGERGRIDKGTVLAMLTRFNLFWGNYQEALDAANKLINLHFYGLESNLLDVFTIKGQKSKEIITSYQHVQNTYKFTDVIRFYNNADGGWASFTPTQNLVDMFEMANGKTIDEPDSGYDPVHPFYNRDPRLKNTVIYSGLDWVGRNNVKRIFDTLDKELPNGTTNKDYYLAATNASHTGMLWAKYAYPNQSQYSTAMNDDSVCPVIFRYAEILLSKAEALVELNKDFNIVFNILDQLRNRGGHVKVNRSKYNTQAKLRELVRRERTIELAGEGFRYEDIVRWDEYDESGNKTGKKVAETVMPGDLLRLCGHVDYNEPNPDKRAVINVNASREDRLIEVRQFDKRQFVLPIPQVEMDKNKNLKQNPGYEEEKE